MTTTRNEVDYVITEYGVAQLAGKTNLQRLNALVSISHPDFRDEIMFKAKKLFYGAECYLDIKEPECKEELKWILHSPVNTK